MKLAPPAPGVSLTPTPSPRVAASSSSGRGTIHVFRATPHAPVPAMVAKRSIRVAGHETSISLEDGFWQVLTAFARADNVHLRDLVSEIAAGRRTRAKLSSAIRLYVLDRLLSVAVVP